LIRSVGDKADNDCAIESRLYLTALLALFLNNWTIWRSKAILIII